MLLEKLVSQPLLQRLGFAALEAGTSNQSTEVEFAQGLHQEPPQTLGGGRLAFGGGEAHDAVRISQLLQPVRAESRAIGKVEPVWRGHR